MSAISKRIPPVFCIAFFAVCVACLLYPDHWVLPLPIAATFGPILSIRMGFTLGIPVLLLCVGLGIPFLMKQTPLSSLMLAIALGIWGFIGLKSGGLLYA